MLIHPRLTFALLAVLVLNLGTLHSWGFYTPWAFLAVIVAILLGIAALRARPGEIPLAGRSTVCAAVVLHFAAMFSTGQLYSEPNSGILLPTVIGFSFAATVVVGIWSTNPEFSRKLFVIALCIVLTGGLTLRTLAIHSSPDPVVDVLALLRDGADHIIAGDNPYASDIVTPYGTPRARQFGVTEPPDPRPAGYPPLPLILSIPPRLLGLDVRYSIAAADCVGAVAIALAGYRRRQPGIGLFIAATYLQLPRVPFFIEQAWYEPMIAALLGLGLVLAEMCGAWQWCGYILLGLGLTAKQFGLPLLFPLAAGHRRHWKLLVLGLAAAGLVMLPWIVWSPRDFFDIVLWKHLDRPLQPHSITVASFLLNEFGVTMPRAVGWLLAAAAILGISVVTPRDSAATALGLGTALLAFCVFHTQGFPNYFYLVQYLWLLGFVAALPRLEETMTHEPARAAA